jgi:hypothetical protein
MRFILRILFALTAIGLAAKWYWVFHGKVETHLAVIPLESAFMTLLCACAIVEAVESIGRKLNKTLKLTWLDLRNARPAAPPPPKMYDAGAAAEPDRDAREFEQFCDGLHQR